MISIVIPALDEEGAIASTIVGLQRILEAEGLIPYEIVVVDDGSSDATAKLAGDSGARVVSHPHNVGYGRSLKDGILAARYDTIVITDADGTYPIETVPKLVREYQRGFDMVVGAREGEHYRQSIIKSPLRAILKFIVEFSAARRVPDVNSGLRVFSRATAISYFRHLCDTFSFTTSMTLAYMMNSRFVHYVPIIYLERDGQSKVRLFRDSMRTMQYIIEAATYYNPLKIFSFFAFLCLLLAVTSLVAALMFQLVSLFLLGVGCCRSSC
jgi:polyisoprenyl-phosphate glycosyltransferase